MLSLFIRFLCRPFCYRSSLSSLAEVHIVKAMVFPIVMYRCESWTIKKAESWRTDAFELWCWRRLLRIPWTVKRSNQSILKEISPEYSLEELTLRLKLQYFGHLMQRTDLLEKTLILGKIEGKRRRGRQRMRWLNATTTQWTWVCANSRRWWRTGKPGVLQSMGWQRVGHNLVAEQQQTFWYSPNMFRDSSPSCLPWAICSVWSAGPSLPIQILPFP